MARGWTEATNPSVAWREEREPTIRERKRARTAGQRRLFAEGPVGAAFVGKAFSFSTGQNSDEVDTAKIVLVLFLETDLPSCLF